MLLSMTGYGKAVVEVGSKIISMEIKSLNSKQLEINTRIPPLYKEKDIEIRNILGEKLVRGKIEFYMNVEFLEAKETPELNSVVIKNYYDQMADIASEMKISLPSNPLDTIMRLPDTLSATKQELDDEEWGMISGKLHNALEELIHFRAQEGTVLEKDIWGRINLILTKMDSISKYESKRMENVKTRMLTSLKESLGVDKVNGERFEQELIYYLEKMDITEERVRLKNHCDYFLKTIKEEGANGKKLGFISQEIGREINTIGSKANDSDIQRIVVEMKDELEKIKEQLMNVL